VRAIADEIDELVAEVNDGHLVGLLFGLEGQETAVKLQRFADIADLDCDVIDTDGARLGCLGGFLHDESSVQFAKCYARRPARVAGPVTARFRSRRSTPDWRQSPGL